MGIEIDLKHQEDITKMLDDLFNSGNDLKENLWLTKEEEKTEDIASVFIQADVETHPGRKYPTTDKPVKLGLSGEGFGEVDGMTAKDRAEEKMRTVSDESQAKLEKSPRVKSKVEVAMSNALAARIHNGADSSNSSYVSPFTGVQSDEEASATPNSDLEQLLLEEERAMDEKMEEFKKLEESKKKKIQQEVIGHLSKERVYKMSGVVSKEDQINRILDHIADMDAARDKAVEAVKRLQRELS